MLEITTKLVTAPTTYPVTVNEVKAFARITETADDSRLAAVFIPAATEYVEASLKRQLITATWRLTARRFPCGLGIIEFPNPPLISISSLNYVDSAGTTELVAEAYYQVDIDSEPGRVAPASGESWPEADSERFDAVIIQYLCGYGIASAVPAHIKLAIMVLCKHWYDRGSIDNAALSGATRHSFDALIGKERIEPPNYEDW